MAEAREQEVEEDSGEVFFPTELNCHVRQLGDLGQEAQHSICEPKVDLHLRIGINVAPCLSITKPGDLLPNLALLCNKMTPTTSSLEKVARLEESSVLATLEERAEKKKSFPFRSVDSDLNREKDFPPLTLFFKCGGEKACALVHDPKLISANLCSERFRPTWSFSKS